tara:strand:- start:147 stop:473 length:327 start_codon:yes stop_codon:yes gene_type:complete
MSFRLVKFFNIFFVYFFLFANAGLAEPILTKSEILKKSNKCFEYSQNQLCKELIFQLERVQIFEFEQNKFKCQSSILGLQSELIEAHYFQNMPKFKNGIMVDYVIKNC